jgi:hypothetical protein
MHNNIGGFTRIVAAALFAAVLAGCTGPKPLKPISANDPEFKALEAERVKFREKKVALVKDAMDLAPSENDAFWREYYDYEKELKKLYDDRYVIIRDYAANYENMTDEIADNLALRSLKLRENRDALLKKYYYRIKKATSATTAARFLQVENEIILLSDLKISSETPILPRGARESLK